MLWGSFHCLFWYPIPLSEYSGSSNNLILALFLRERVGIAWASQVALVIKSPPANAGDTREAGSIPGLGRSPGGGKGNPFLPGKSHRQSLVGYSPWGHSIRCERAHGTHTHTYTNTHTHTQESCICLLSHFLRQLLHLFYALFKFSTLPPSPLL